MLAAKVDRLRGVILCAPRAPETADFYTNVWGLDIVSRSEDAVQLRATGAEHHILELRRGPEPQLGGIEMGAADSGAVDALHDRAVKKGLRIASPPKTRSSPGGGYGFELIDPENRLILISAGVAAHVDANDIPVRPIKVAHIVLNTLDVQGMQELYCDLFGFVVSDWSEDQMAFIRCNNDHHNIAFNRADYVSLNHVSFQMPGFDSVMKGIGRLKDQNYSVKWGAGCHGIGDIMFAYFIDPNAFVIEYNYYVRPFDAERHQPKVWQRSRDNMDAWGTAGLPSAEIRQAMAGTPQR